ncbi:MAG: serine O-acetyltransferase [Akkermansiaceae bacterium]
MDHNSNSNTYKLCHATDVDIKQSWESIKLRATHLADTEPQLQALLSDVILVRPCINTALAARLARKLGREDMSRDELMPLLLEIFTADKKITCSAVADMQAIVDRDPACQNMLEPMLFFKGFLAVTTHRIAHYLWNQNRKPLALYFQSITSEVFGVDIHPGAQIGCGIFIDHATSVVIGETAIVEDDVSIMHEVTLGGTGKQEGARHPIVRTGVLIGAGAKILGRVEICTGAKIGAGSVVLQDVPPHTTVAGVPAIEVGTSSEENPAQEMNQNLACGKI